MKNFISLAKWVVLVAAIAILIYPHTTIMSRYNALFILYVPIAYFVYGWFQKVDKA
jgi:hypothetical protein